MSNGRIWWNHTTSGLNEPSMIRFLSAGGRSYMLGSDPDPDQPGGDPAQEREPRDELDGELRRDLLRASQDAPDDPILHEDLQPLGDEGRPLAPPLHPSEVLGGQPVLAQRR